MDTTTISIHGAAELLSAVPYQLGFHPSHSIVLLSVRPGRGRLGLTVREELATLRGPYGRAVAGDLAGLMADDAAAYVIAVRYPGPADPAPAEDAGLQAILAALAALFDHVECWNVTETYYEPLDPDDGMPLADPRPVEELRETNAAAAFTAAGVAPLDSREELVRLPAAGPAETRSARRAATRAWDSRVAIPGPALWAEWQRPLLDEFLMLLSRAAEPAWDETALIETFPRQLGRLAALLHDPIGRDGVLMAMLEPEALAAVAAHLATAPGGPGEDTAAAGPGPVGEAVPDGWPIDPRLGVVVGPEAAAAGLRVLTSAAALASEKRRGCPLAVAAWLAWWSGDGLRAAEWGARALEHPDAPPLAELVLTMIDQRITPWLPGRAERVLTGVE
ncbi:MAG: DUF4192 domain-containing protein [Bifidobacteriaceae bacterium]|jgi:hypothetical protein|nr:DUF4192 domain-containing protein [Bifidobacteriaceae bacterium]